MMPVFIHDFGINGLWMSVFHSISAFCNAGFDILGSQDCLYPSLTGYSNNYIINIIIMFLIIAGGIGFFTWDDIYTHKFHIKDTACKANHPYNNSSFNYPSGCTFLSL